jgi:hypothetical protein
MVVLDSRTSSANGAFFRVLEHLCIGRATRRGLLLRGVAALIFHFAAIEAHSQDSTMPVGATGRDEYRQAAGDAAPSA